MTTEWALTVTAEAEVIPGGQTENDKDASGVPEEDED